MGKGDKKSKRGKLFQGSYGVRRRKKGAKNATFIKPKDVKEPVKDVKDVKEVKDSKEVKDIKEVKDTHTAATAKPKAPAAKKEPRAKKTETT
ncbi:MAG TPA: 30S ribosomal protein THX [Bacteroidales bacterium]|nr:30S ribosomal protein THX [Bacteroidales bacterium]